MSQRYAHRGYHNRFREDYELERTNDLGTIIIFVVVGIVAVYLFAQVAVFIAAVVFLTIAALVPAVIVPVFLVFSGIFETITAPETYSEMTRSASFWAGEIYNYERPSLDHLFGDPGHVGLTKLDETYRTALIVVLVVSIAVVISCAINVYVCVCVTPTRRKM
jgi:hypothetical protein